MTLELQSLQKQMNGLQMMSDIDAALKGVENKDLLIYVHVPFCNSKCVFCDWVVNIPVRDLTSGSRLGDQYVAALSKHIRAYAAELGKIGYTPKYIYWGGGTPSRLQSSQIREVVSVLKESFDLSSLQQHMMETSPETLSMEKLETILSLGIERISMGTQSFDDAELRRSARSHSSEQAKNSIRMIQSAGFDDFNIDLIAALPEQKLETLEQSVQTTIELGVPHVSVYVYRPNLDTVMAKQSASGHRELVTYKKMLDYYTRAKELLEEAGYHEYTTFYFAKDLKHRFKGEMYYFELRGDYVGFGSGGQSVLGHRSMKNATNIHNYMDDPFAIESCEVFSPTKLGDQLFLLLTEAVITSAGINFENFERLIGFPFSYIRNHPLMEVVTQYYEDCGAVFEETEESLIVTAETRSKAYIGYLAGIYEAGRLRSNMAPAS